MNAMNAMKYFGLKVEVPVEVQVEVQVSDLAVEHSAEVLASELCMSLRNE